MVTILGPRQSGKTTLARMTFPDLSHFSLEDPDVRMAAEADPRGFLGRMEGGGILDEVQRFPALLSYIQGMVDKTRKRGRFLLTGSHQPRLHGAISQSLAGRTAMLTLLPFSLHELRRYGSASDAFDLIRRGFFPGLHEEGLEPRRFFNSYLQTYVERDVRALIQLRDLSQFQKFLTLLAGRVGQGVNLASLGNNAGASSTTIRNWLSVLKASYVVFELSPFFENVQQRVIKSPRIFFTDVGLAAFLLGIHTVEQASRDPLWRLPVDSARLPDDTCQRPYPGQESFGPPAEYEMLHWMEYGRTDSVGLREPSLHGTRGDSAGIAADREDGSGGGPPHDPFSRR